jgi:uncharacterized membrane protein
MDWMTAIPMMIDSIAQLSAAAMSALAMRLLTIALAGLIIAGVTGFALAGFAWLWLKHTIDEFFHIPATPARS